MESKKNTRTIFLDACSEIANLLKDSNFKVLQKGQTLKKVSVNKDLIYEIYFQSSYLNAACDIQVLPHLTIYSKKLKDWQIKQTGNQHCQGAVYSNTLGYLSPCGYRKWNVAGMNGTNEINQIAALLNDYALPIFNLFDNIQNAIDFLKVNGTQFNTYTEKSIMPIDFLILYADKIESEQFFNNFIASCSYKGRIISLYKELETTKNIDLNYFDFYEADKVKLAFIHELKIDEKQFYPPY
ncbi:MULTISPECIES: hypothetical protein [unclassified Myroides]|uniref:hypothetical protein n=1 Tax=unclassified Myroides TaxID=2642485 RepID=UPI003D2F6C20